MSIGIFCASCGAQGSVEKVTENLQCRCGSHDLGLDGVDINPHEATRWNGAHHRAEFDLDPELTNPHNATRNGGGTGWNEARPDPLAGWSDYVGPNPGRNPEVGQHLVNDNLICPACHGFGYDIADRTLCRECNGTGRVTPSTSQPNKETLDATTQGPASGGARWQGATASALNTNSSQVILTLNGQQVPAQLTFNAGRPSLAEPYGTAEYQNMHTAPGYNGNPDSFPNRSHNVPYREDKDYSEPAGPMALNQVACPECGYRPTHLVKDKNENAWWHCSNCGPLANIDKHPEIDPYSKANYTGPDRSMKKAGRFFNRSVPTGRLFTVMAKIAERNDALSDMQILDLARKTVAKLV